MKKLVATTYRTLLKGAVKADRDFARRALITSAPTQIYDFYENRWIDIDVARELHENERTLNDIVRRLNSGREWFVPPAQGTSGSVVRDNAVSAEVRRVFRSQPNTTQNLNLAFAGVKALNAVDVASKGIPPKPLHAPAEFSFRVTQNALDDVSGPRAPDAPLGVLVAHPMMSGFFRHSIILLAECNEQGAVGVIVNKPLLNEHGQGVPVWAVVGDSLMPLFTKHLKNNPVMIGGPVRAVDDRVPEGGGLFLVHCIPDIPDASPVGQGIFLSGNVEAIEKALDSGRAAPKDVMVVVGYAGWGAGQLGGEVERGSWFVAKGTDAAPVFQLNGFVDKDDAEDSGDAEAATPSPLAPHPLESWVKFCGGLGPAYAEMSRLAHVSFASPADDSDD